MRRNANGFIPLSERFKASIQDTLERKERLIQYREDKMLLKDEPKANSDFEPAPAGNHAARCIAIVDLGSRPKLKYQSTTEYKDVHEVWILWELPNKIRTFEHEGEMRSEPFSVSNFYTLSMHDKSNLSLMLTGWRGRAFTEDEKKGFDLNNLLGLPCLLDVIHYTNGAGYVKAKARAAGRLPEGMECPPQVNPSVSFSFDEFSQDSLNGVSEGIRKMVMESNEYKAMGLTSPPTEQGVPTPPSRAEPPKPAYDDSEIPF